MVERSSTRGGATARDDRFELSAHAQRVVFGAGRVTEVPVELDALGLRSIALVASGSAKHAADHLADQLGTRVVARVHEVVQHVPEADVDRTVDMGVAADADGVLTLGGGSATGLGKAVAVRTGLPLVAVPTTYSGSEATPVYGITGERKRTARDARALPRTVVYDPELTVSMPRTVTATSGLNAVAHCVEALYGPTVSPLAGTLAEKAIRMLAASLPVVLDSPDDMAARSEALYAAYLAGWCMASAGTALHHTLCHVIAGIYPAGHGALHAVLLPYVAAYNAAAAPEPLRRVARALGATNAAAGLHRLARNLDAPRDLASLGVPADALDDVARRAVAETGDRNPRRPDAPSLGRLLADAYTGRPPGTY